MISKSKLLLKSLYVWVKLGQYVHFKECIKLCWTTDFSTSLSGTSQSWEYWKLVRFLDVYTNREKINAVNYYSYITHFLCIFQIEIQQRNSKMETCLQGSCQRHQKLCQWGSNSALHQQPANLNALNFIIFFFRSVISTPYWISL